MKTILSILVVENNPTLASHLISYLTGLGWNVDFAASGKLARRLCKQHDYDVVLLDTHLPDMSYQDALGTLNSGKGVGVPVITLASDQPFEVGRKENIVTDPINCKDVANRCLAIASRRHLAISA